MDKNKENFFCPMLKNVVIGAKGCFSPCCHIPTDIKWGQFPDPSEELNDFKKKFQTATSLIEIPLKCQKCPRLFTERATFSSKKKKWENLEVLD